MGDLFIEFFTRKKEIYKRFCRVWQGAVITGRLFSIRSTASNVLQDGLPRSDEARIKQRRLQNELRQQQQQQQSVGDCGGVESSAICSSRSGRNALLPAFQYELYPPIVERQNIFEKPHFS